MDNQRNLKTAYLDRREFSLSQIYRAQLTTPLSFFFNFSPRQLSTSVCTGIHANQIPFSRLKKASSNILSTSMHQGATHLHPPHPLIIGAILLPPSLPPTHLLVTLLWTVSHQTMSHHRGTHLRALGQTTLLII
ncbi:hypothetical protein LENED_005157 [Lentinula edodes]|uniref:Uncharacterized protein n=1 Tax=Lentinula edodes TaxID=5353 RepID=A0A1Q3E8B6_LENED|nr:hypothetical protein LENED_005157 [Lentinula edodes]